MDTQVKVIDCDIYFKVRCECGNEVAITDWGWILCDECEKWEYGVDIRSRPVETNSETSEDIITEDIRNIVYFYLNGALLLDEFHTWYLINYLSVHALDQDESVELDFLFTKLMDGQINEEQFKDQLRALYKLDTPPPLPRG